MIKVLITGATGFIGNALVKRLSANSSISLILANSKTTRDELECMLHQSSFVYHLAAVHRPEDPAEYLITNLGLTEFILEILKSKKAKTRILYTSSVHAAAASTSYGASKRAAEELIIQSLQTNVSANFIRLPHVFGPHGKESYTSVLHTFCYRISNSKSFSVNDLNIILDFIYIDDLLEGMEQFLYEDHAISILQAHINKHITQLSLERLLYLILSIKLQINPNIGGVSNVFLNNLKKTFESYY
jgi:UDP-2-acetamido-2,6-beta-L-arabino-hexul-4-ose reductase